MVRAKSKPKPADVQYADARGKLIRIEYSDFMERPHRKRRVGKRRRKRGLHEFRKAVRKFHQRANPCGLPYVYELDCYPQLVTR
jgi:hypothetical protein